ncbi:MAG TPA: hypothetical protein VGL58_19825 [Caulobacteraceae bacterium]|jgi:hypothetical protein
MITKQRWFAPKDASWGWQPASWQGWLVTAIFVAIVGAAVAYFRTRLVVALAIGVVSLTALYGVILLTGSKRGGPGLR